MIYVLVIFKVMCLLVSAVLLWVMVEACSHQDWVRRIIVYSCASIGVIIGIALTINLIRPDMQDYAPRAKATLACAPTFLMLLVGNTIADFFRE